MDNPDTNDDIHKRKIRRSGVLMIVLGWAMAFFAVTLFYRSVLLDRDNPNRLSVLSAQTEALQLRQNRQGHYVLEGLMNGVQVRYLLDTGATQIAIPGHIADRLNLQRQGKRTIRTASDILDVDTTRVSAIIIGAYRFSDMRAIVVDNMPGDQVLLGMNALNHFDISQRDDILTLKPAAGRR